MPGLDTLFLASPKTDIEQSVGRILRQKAADRKNVPLIFDVVDAFSVFEAQGKKRRAYYKRQNYSIKVADINTDPLLLLQRQQHEQQHVYEQDDSTPNKHCSEYAFQCVNE